MSKPPRFFILPEQISGSHIILSGPDVRHIATVLRMKPGEMLSLCDGTGLEYSGSITKMSRTEILVETTGNSKVCFPGPRMTLGQGLPKHDKMDWIVQKATELGVSRIVPLETERTIAKVKDQQKRLDRWQKISREAAMQSRRIDIPGILPVARFEDFAAMPDSGRPTLKLLPWEEGTRPIQEILQPHSSVRDFIVLIGPEGGISTAEAELAMSNGFYPVSLGPNILRTETAAIVTLSMIVFACT